MEYNIYSLPSRFAFLRGKDTRGVLNNKCIYILVCCLKCLLYVCWIIVRNEAILKWYIKVKEFSIANTSCVVYICWFLDSTYITDRTLCVANTVVSEVGRVVYPFVWDASSHSSYTRVPTCTTRSLTVAPRSPHALSLLHHAHHTLSHCCTTRTLTVAPRIYTVCLSVCLSVRLPLCVCV